MDFDDIRFFKKYTQASNCVTMGRVLAAIMNVIPPENERVSKLDWGTFAHRFFSLNNQPDTTPAVLIRRIRALYTHSPTLMKGADLLEMFGTTPNIAIFEATKWLMEIAPDRVEKTLKSAQDAYFNLVLAPETVEARTHKPE